MIFTLRFLLACCPTHTHRRSKFLKPSDSNSDHLRNPSTTSETAEMSCSLPQEILDHIIDHLHDQPEALKACSLVSKAWIYRTRRYIFNHIEFSSRSRHVSHWQETFPDLATSPAHNTRLLSISLTKLISPAEADTLRTFRCVSHLNVDTTRWYDQLSSLAPLRGLSPVVRSLCLSFAGLPSSEIFGLVCSFPLLEDLALVGYIGRKRDEVWDTPSTLPKLTGSLDLPVGGGVQTIARRLLDLPDGLRFKKISVQWSTMESITPTINLVSGCSDTLESLTITNYLKDAPAIGSLDLSNATKLKDVVFQCKVPNVQWITVALFTAESNSLQSVSLVLSPQVIVDALTLGEVLQEWLDLDRLLVKIWTSHWLHLKFVHEWVEAGSSDGHVSRLLPESTKRGIIDTIKYGATAQTE